jgi:hypothetical protein
MVSNILTHDKRMAFMLPTEGYLQPTEMYLKLQIQTKADDAEQSGASISSGIALIDSWRIYGNDVVLVRDSIAPKAYYGHHSGIVLPNSIVDGDYSTYTDLNIYVSPYMNIGFVGTVPLNLCAMKCEFQLIHPCILNPSRGFDYRISYAELVCKINDCL